MQYLINVYTTSNHFSIQAKLSCSCLEYRQSSYTFACKETHIKHGGQSSSHKSDVPSNMWHSPQHAETEVAMYYCIMGLWQMPFLHCKIKERFMQLNSYYYGIHWFDTSVVDMGLYCKKVTVEVYSKFVTIPIVVSRWKTFMINIKLWRTVRE